MSSVQEVTIISLVFAHQSVLEHGSVTE